MQYQAVILLLILAIPIYFLWRRILRSKLKNPKYKSLVLGLLTLVSAPLVYLGFIISFIWFVSYHPKHQFDKEVWTNDVEKRFQLSDNIIDSEMLINKTKEEVIDLLGQENNEMDNDSWSYYLGFKPGLLSIDPDILELTFENGKVVDVRQYKS